MFFTPSPTIGEALERAAREPGARGTALYDRRGQSSEFRTHAEIFQRARESAGRLAAAGIGPADRLLLCLPTSWELIDAFLGAVLRGALPTLVAPAGALGGAAAHAAKIRGLIALLGPQRFYCDESTRRMLLEFGEKSAADLSLVPNELNSLAPLAITPHIAAPDDLAFMQLTSGSTGSQRAVMIRHANVAANAHAIGTLSDAAPFSDENGVVSWLPLNHDMGLVGCILFPIFYGLDLKLLRPESFLARPNLWLKMLSTQNNPFAPAPNFAYQLCVERADPAELKGCDLSNWRCALSGAEMIRPETCAAFEAKFSALGFKPRAWLACYGMAEATLAATSDTRRQGIRTLAAPRGMQAEMGLKELVCCGEPVRDSRIRISPPASQDALGEGQVGEICINGPGIFAGYYNDAEATAAALQDGWLRTGDLGFLKDGELYITGRLKDVLIVHGHNIMPHEIEWLAESATGAGGAERSGAFSVAHGADGEQAVVVLEISGIEGERLSALAHEIRSRVGRGLGLPLADIVLVRRGQIPKTTSGKVQRAELRRRYLENKLERLAI
ncbi:MAG TPA: AMP-binding protein [Planctomycetota bacterium]|nr:AMP-binding protein [Planctomycetota bacterium]